MAFLFKPLLSQAFNGMEKINTLQCRYLELSDSILALKNSKRELKLKLRQSRNEYEYITTNPNPNLPLKKLLKADKKTSIAGLERLLAKSRRSIRKLEEEKERVFRKRERIKAKTVKKLGFGERLEGGQVVAINKVNDVASVAKMMELVRVSPRCRIGEKVKDDEERVEKIREAAMRMKVEISEERESEIVEDEEVEKSEIMVEKNESGLVEKRRKMTMVKKR